MMLVQVLAMGEDGEWMRDVPRSKLAMHCSIQWNAVTQRCTTDVSDTSIKEGISNIIEFLLLFSSCDTVSIILGAAVILVLGVVVVVV